MRTLTLAVVLVIFSTACDAGEDKKASPPANAIRVVHEATTGSTVYLVQSPKDERCLDVVVVTLDGKAHKGSQGCKLDEIEPLEQVGGGGLGSQVGINYAFGKAPEGTKIVRGFDETGRIYSDTRVTDWWIIVLGSTGRLPMSFEALDGRGSVILRRDEGQRAGGTPTETPSVRIEPRSGPAGTLVKVTGDGFDKQMQSRIRLGSEQLGLHQKITNCELIASSEVVVSIDEAGHLEGQFVIPAKPKCLGEERGGPLSPGLWAVFVGCRLCLYADFRITK